MVGTHGDIWHRMGDLGWLDDEGRIWFCGRKAERVITEEGVLFTECVEGIVNVVPGVYRSALVGSKSRVDANHDDLSHSTPVVVLELVSGADADAVMSDVKEALARRPMTAMIDDVRVRPSLPVDIRHNAKIKRSQISKSL